MIAELRNIGRGRLAAIVLAGLAAACAGSLPASAQQGWLPTVATSPGASDGAALPLMVDPDQFPPADAPASGVAPAGAAPVPAGDWSSIITGALPESRPGSVQVPPVARGATSRDLEPVEGPTPLRPLVTKKPALPVTTAAAAAATPAAGPAAALAKAPAAGSGPADTATADETADPLFKKPNPLDALPPDASAAQQYCFNTADTAADARFAWQAKKIKEMEAALEQKSQQLVAKTEEYKLWLERRDAFSRKAHEKLVGFYSRMRPDAAALQLATIDEETAAAVLVKLETKVASQIMGEMDPERAAKVATMISGAAKIPPRPAAALPTAQKAPPPALPKL